MVCLMVYTAWHAAVPAPEASFPHGQEAICLRPMLPKDPPGHHVPRVQGVSAIRSLEMAAKPGMRGRDRKVFDNLEAVEV